MAELGGDKKKKKKKKDKDKKGKKEKKELKVAQLYDDGGGLGDSAEGIEGQANFAAGDPDDDIDSIIVQHQNKLNADGGSEVGSNFVQR